MIEERALILETNYVMAAQAEAVARVRVQRTSSCESCSLKSGCGQSTMNKLSANHCLELDVENSLGAKPGDEVLIAIPEQGLLNASLRIYLIPLVLMLIGALAGDMLFAGHELWTMLLAFSGLSFGFIWARLFSQKHALHAHFLPKMTRILVSRIAE